MEEYIKRFCKTNDVDYCIYYKTKVCPMTCSYATKQSKLEKGAKDEKSDKKRLN